MSVKTGKTSVTFLLYLTVT